MLPHLSPSGAELVRLSCPGGGRPAMTSIERRGRDQIDWLGSAGGCLREDGLILVKEFWRFWGCEEAARYSDDDVDWN